MLTQELLAEAAVIATQALSAGPAFHSRSAAVALVVRKQHLTYQGTVVGPTADKSRHTGFLYSNSNTANSAKPKVLSKNSSKARKKWEKLETLRISGFHWQQQAVAPLQPPLTKNALTWLLFRGCNPVMRAALPSSPSLPRRPSPSSFSYTALGRWLSAPAAARRSLIRFSPQPPSNTPSE